MAAWDVHQLWLPVEELGCCSCRGVATSIRHLRIHVKDCLVHHDSTSHTCIAWYSGSCLHPVDGMMPALYRDE